MNELDVLKNQAKGVVGKGRGKNKPDPSVKLPEPTGEPVDINLCLLSSEQIRVMLDLLYDGLEGKGSKADKKIMLDTIKYLEYSDSMEP